MVGDSSFPPHFTFKEENRLKNFYVAAFDGSATPNPGEMNIGGYIKDNNGKEILRISENKGHGTNNQAEYLALIEVLNKLIEMGIKEVAIFGDSALVVNQVIGKWRIKNPNIRNLAREAQELVKQFDHCEIRWINRDYNTEADNLSKGGI